MTDEKWVQKHEQYSGWKSLLYSFNSFDTNGQFFHSYQAVSLFYLPNYRHRIEITK